MATPPRCVLPGVTYLVTRRCSEQRFFLRPSKTTNDIFLFLLAVAADRYGVLIHAFCVMSNHFHLVLTDVNGELPRFHQYLDALVARAVNRAIAHSEAFWDRESYSAIPLCTTDDVLAKMTYTLANPVAAELVRDARTWPGLWSDPGRIGGPPLVVERPRGLFGKKGSLPASAQLGLCPPPGFADAASLRATLEEALAEAQARAAAEVAREGRSFLGAARACAQDPGDRPVTRPPRGGLKPRFAGRSREVLLEALLRWREFLEAYWEALAAWRAGSRDVVFPPGTWWMRVHYAVRCAQSG
jgi:REP element-mobilizing transposase RayT